MLKQNEVDMKAELKIRMILHHYNIKFNIYDLLNLNLDLRKGS